MQTIGFSHSKLVMRIVGCTLGALMMVFLSIGLHGAAVPLVLAAFFAGVAGLSAFSIMSGKAALELDGRGMTLNNLLTSQTVAWADVASVRIEAMTVYFLGFIPAARHGHLVVKTTGSWLRGNKIRVSTRMMALPPGGHSELLRLIEAARASGADGVAHERTATGPDQASGFDPDAAIAQYLERKAGQDSAAVPARPAFGRKQV